MVYSKKILFLDLVGLHTELEEELVATFRQALKGAHFVGGPVLEQFEESFANFCETTFCVGVANGTDAVRFAVMAAGVEAGDIVVTVPNTFIATTEAISQAGAVPHFIDIDEKTYNLDASKVKQYFENECCVDVSSGRLVHTSSNRHVSAIVPVHLYGQTADMDSILELAANYKLTVIEDACQAHGAEYYSQTHKRWYKAGSMGVAAAFSFYPGKNLGACGEAGAVTTNDEAIASKIRMLRDHGQSRKYYHDMEGYNGRLDSVQAGILAAKLTHLSKWNAQRRELAMNYNRLFAEHCPSLVLPQEPSWAKSVYHLYVVRVQNRDQVQAHLNEANIGTGIHYPIPLHLQNAYTKLGYRVGDFPCTERVAKEILSLPMYPQLSETQQQRVAEVMLECVSDFDACHDLATLTN